MASGLLPMGSLRNEVVVKGKQDAPKLRRPAQQIRIGQAGRSVFLGAQNVYAASTKAPYKRIWDMDTTYSRALMEFAQPL